MKKLRALALVAIALGLTIPALPAAAADNSGLNVQVFTYGDGGSPDRTATYTPCANAWTHVDLIDHDYDENYASVVAGCQEDHVIVHYTGAVTFPDSGTYSFLGLADDGFWMSLDGNPVITDDWFDKGRGGNPYPDIAIEGGHAYALDAWFYENGGGANATLQYQIQGVSPDWITVPASFYKTSVAPATIEVQLDFGSADVGTSLTYVVGTPGITLPKPFKTGAVFVGWAKDSTDGLIVDSESYIPDAPVTLHAVFTDAIVTDDVKRTLAETGTSPWYLFLGAMSLATVGGVLIRKTKRS
jgi:LPXTG-motif cell wall-anchored protein